MSLGSPSSSAAAVSGSMSISVAAASVAAGSASASVGIRSASASASGSMDFAAAGSAAAGSTAAGSMAAASPAAAGLSRAANAMSASAARRRGRFMYGMIPEEEGWGKKTVSDASAWRVRRVSDGHRPERRTYRVFGTRLITSSEKQSCHEFRGKNEWLNFSCHNTQTRGHLRHLEALFQLRFISAWPPAPRASVPVAPPRSAPCPPYPRPDPPSPRSPSG